jgi:hypothetical protein
MSIPMWIPGSTRLKYWLLCSFAILSTAAFAGNEVSPLPSHVQQHFESGFRSLYHLDYAAAKNEFHLMIAKDSKHPAGYVYLASALWLERLAKLRRVQTQVYNRGNAFFRQRENSLDPAL